MLFSDRYKTISQPVEGVFKDKGSKFIAYAFPFLNEENLKEIIQNLKFKNPKANHFCYAYRLTPNRTVYKVNDDGEPAGTAGKPILNTLLSKDLTNILVVVVRFFGGTLLGVSGLINAYKSATEEAILNAQVVEKTVQEVYQISFEYVSMNELMKLIKEENLTAFEQAFDLSCKLKLAINQSDVNRIMSKLEVLDHIKIQFIQTI